MAINLFIPKFSTDEILLEIRQCLERGWTGLGFKTIEFEKAWIEYSKFPFAHYVNSNTAGLHLALAVFKAVDHWEDGDEIITTPLTFVSTNHAILYERLKPVFADVDEYLCLDPTSVLDRITNKTKAIMFVGMGGNSGRYKEIVAICKSKGIRLILDAAHMAGTHIDGKHIGLDADVTVFSYQAVKNLPTGDSGMICFKEESLDAMVRKMSWLGINKTTYERFKESDSSYRWKYDIDDVGFKYHGNSIMASIGLVQLKYLESGNTRRREICSMYEELLKGVKGITTVQTFPGCESSRHLFQVRVDSREKVLTHMYKAEVFPGVHYRDNIEYPMYQYAEGTCPQARLASEQVLSLPLHLNLTDEDVRTVAAVLIDAVKKTEAECKAA